MRRVASIAALVAPAVVVMGCGATDKRVCADAPTYERAISGVPARAPEFKAELLEDVAEAATEANCPGYNSKDD